MSTTNAKAHRVDVPHHGQMEHLWAEWCALKIERDRFRAALEYIGEVARTDGSTPLATIAPFAKAVLQP